MAIKPGLLVLCAMFLGFSAGTAEAQIAAIEGYDGYKFGMTVEQAARVKPSTPYTSCGFHDVVGCMEYEKSVSDYKGRVVVQFKGNPARVDQIIVQFGQFEEPVEYPCRRAGEAILDLLLVKYGTPPRVEGNAAIWISPYGGQVSLINLCIVSGLAVLSYRGSDPL